MAIVDLPFVYRLQAVPPRRRTAVATSAVETVQVEIPEYAGDDLERFSCGRFVGSRIGDRCHLPWIENSWGMSHAVLREGRIRVLDVLSSDHAPPLEVLDLWHLASPDPRDHATKDLVDAACRGERLPVENDFRDVLRSERSERMAQVVDLARDLAIVDGLVVCSRMRLVDASLRTRSGLHVEDAARWMLPDMVDSGFQPLRDARLTGKTAIEGRYDVPLYPDLARGVLRVHAEFMAAVGTGDLSTCGASLLALDDLVSDLLSGAVDPEDVDVIVPIVAAAGEAALNEGSIPGSNGSATYRTAKHVAEMADDRRRLGHASDLAPMRA